MEYGIIIAIVVLSVVVALYFNRRDVYDSIESTETSHDYSGWTKKDLQEYALTKYNTKLPNSMKKQDMIDSIVNISNEV